MAVAREAEQLGFDSAWTVDHLFGFRADNATGYASSFEAYGVLAALAASTTRIRLGTLVLCALLRNPALCAKMFSTLDVISNGRMELGIGAGWKRDELEAYGYRFPSLQERLDGLRDQLEIISRMLDAPSPPGATYSGRTANVLKAVNLPGPVQKPRLPIMVGGNGPNVTWRLAALYADELNLDNLSPDDVASSLPVIRERCVEIGRDPDTLRISVALWWDGRESGAGRKNDLARYRAAGIARVMVAVRNAASRDDVLLKLAVDADAAGIELSQ